MGSLSIEADANYDAVFACFKFNHSGAITKGLFDTLVCNDLGVGTSKVEPHPSVFGFHAG